MKETFLKPGIAIRSSYIASKDFSKAERDLERRSVAEAVLITILIRVLTSGQSYQMVFL